MTTKHTPGPWEIEGGIHLVGDPYKEGQHALYCAGITSSGFVGSVCTLQSADHCSGNPITREQAEANGRLIAAAPELLAFAEKVARICNGDEVGNPIMLLQAFGDEARAAIAKATNS